MQEILWNRRSRDRESLSGTCQRNQAQESSTWNLTNDDQKDKNENKKNYNSKREDLEEEDQGEDERNVIL